MNGTKIVNVTRTELEQKLREATVSPSTRRDLLIGLSALIGGTLVSRAAKAEAFLGDISATSRRHALDSLGRTSSSTILGDLKDGVRTVAGTGLPKHFTGQLAMPSVQNFRIPIVPSVGAKATPCGSTCFGVSIDNAIPIDPTGPNLFQNGVSTKLGLDPTSSLIYADFNLHRDNQGHLQPDGSYHYHFVPRELIQRLVAERTRRGEAEGMILIGWAADGFPIYYAGVYGGIAPVDPMNPNGRQTKMQSSFRLRATPFSGRPFPFEYTNRAGEKLNTLGLFVSDYEYNPGSGGTLDDCNGRYGYTPEFGLTYHYFATDQWPFYPRQWRGTPLANSGFERPSPDDGPGHSIPNNVATRYDMGFQGY